MSNIFIPEATVTPSSGTSSSADAEALVDALRTEFQTEVSTAAVESVGSSLNIASATGTQTVNLGCGSGVQTVNIGQGDGITTIKLGGVGDTVAISGTMTTVNTTNTAVTDSQLVLNSGGTAGSGSNCGIYIEEGGTNTGYMRLASTRDRYEFKSPLDADPYVIDQSLSTGADVTFGSLSTDTLSISDLTVDNISAATITSTGVATLDSATVTNGVSASTLTTSGAATLGSLTTTGPITASGKVLLSSSTANNDGDPTKYPLRIMQDVSASYPTHVSIGGLTNPNQRLDIGYHCAQNYGYIQPLVAGTSWNNLALCAGGGNVGIGKTNPTVSLDVDGGIAGTTLKTSGLATLDSATVTNALSCGSLTTGALATGKTWISESAANTFPAGDVTQAAFRVMQDVHTASSQPFQMSVAGFTDPRQRLDIGYHTTDNYAYIQGHHSEVSWRNIALNPNGANVAIGKTTPTTMLDVAGEITCTKLNTTESSTLDSVTVTNTLTCGALASGALTGTSLTATGGADIAGTLTCGHTTIASDNASQLKITTTDPNRQVHIGYNTSGEFAYIESIHVGAAWRPLILNAEWGNNAFVGVGITNPAVKFDVGGAMRCTGGLQLRGNAGLQLYNVANTYSTVLKGSDSLTESTTLHLPPSTPTVGQVLSCAGASSDTANLEWTTAPMLGKWNTWANRNDFMAPVSLYGTPSVIGTDMGVGDLAPHHLSIMNITDTSQKMDLGYHINTDNMEGYASIQGQKNLSLDVPLKLNHLGGDVTLGALYGTSNVYVGAKLLPNSVYFAMEKANDGTALEVGTVTEGIFGGWDTIVYNRGGITYNEGDIAIPAGDYEITYRYQATINGSTNSLTTYIYDNTAGSRIPSSEIIRSQASGENISQQATFQFTASTAKVLSLRLTATFTTDFAWVYMIIKNI